MCDCSRKQWGVTEKLFILQGDLKGTLASPTAADFVHIFFNSLGMVSSSKPIVDWLDLHSAILSVFIFCLTSTLSSLTYFHVSTVSASVSCRPASHCALSPADSPGPAADQSGRRPGGGPPVDVSGRLLEHPQVRRPSWPSHTYTSLFI